MPVAFHPPLEHPIDMPQAARGAEDTANGDVFAALLAGAGKAPAVASTAGKAPAVVSTAGKAPAVVSIAGKAPAVANAADGEPDDRRTDATDTTLFDPLNLFAAWPGAGAAGANARDTGIAGSPQDAADPALARIPHRRGAAAGDAGAMLAPAIGARDATPDAAEATTKGPAGARAAPARRLTTLHAQDRNAAQAAPADAASSPRGSHAPTAALTASFAAAAAMLAKAPAAAAGDTGISAVDRHDGADAAPGVNLGTSATPATATVSLARPIAEPVGSPGFATQVAGEIAQLVHINADRAQLHVHPADMGPIDVTMSVRHDQVSVMMVAADPQTRAALELALPQLRDLLANQGLALANASVNDHAPRDDGRQRGARDAAARGTAIAGVDTVTAAHASAPAGIALRRLVDLYA